MEKINHSICVSASASGALAIQDRRRIRFYDENVVCEHNA